MNISYLLLANEVSEETTKLVSIISIAAIAVLLVALLTLCLVKRNFDTHSIVYAALCVASSFVLSFIKLAPVTYGGSITLASFVPILIYAYAFGALRALVVGAVYGLLQFVQDPYILTPVTFVLDYLLAFMSIAIMGFMRGKKGDVDGADGGGSAMPKVALSRVVTGTVLVYLFRFIVHFFSGLIYFNLGAIWAEIPATSAVVYSFLYQTVYLIPDMIITLAVLIILVKRGAFARLVKSANKGAGATDEG